LDNAIFAKTAHALQRRLAEDGYMLLLACNDYSSAAELTLARTLLERGVDALVLSGVEHDSQLIDLASAAAVPVICTWAFSPRLVHTCVGFDNNKAGALIANHVAHLGHSKVAILTAHTTMTERHRHRVDSIRATLKARRAEVPADWVIESQLSYESGREGVRRLFSYPHVPTALICSNDVIAIGAMEQCFELGLRVPEDVSISGFEDLEVASYVRPGLTTVRWSQHDLGRIAGDAVVGILTGVLTQEPRQIEVPVELIVRGSTAPPGRLAARSVAGSISSIQSPSTRGARAKR